MREIVCGVLRPGMDVPAVNRIPNDEESVRRLIANLGDRRLLAVCYQAGAVRVRPAPADYLDGGVGRGDRPVAGPEGRLGAGQNRPPRRVGLALRPRC